MSRRRMSWTPHDPLWRQIWQAWRQGGWRRVRERAAPQIATAVWGSSVFLEFVVALQSRPDGAGHPRAAGAASTDEWIGELPPQELPALEPVSSRAMYRHCAALAQEGAFCYAAKIDGAVVAYNWYTAGPYRSLATGIAFPPRPGEAFLIYSHTVRAWRGRGVDYRLKRFTAAALQRRGVGRVRTTVMETNRSAVRTAARWNGRLAGRWLIQRRFWWRRAIALPLAAVPAAPRTPTQEVSHGIA